MSTLNQSHGSNTYMLMGSRSSEVMTSSSLSASCSIGSTPCLIVNRVLSARFIASSSFEDTAGEREDDPELEELNPGEFWDTEDGGKSPRQFGDGSSSAGGDSMISHWLFNG
jgi:hypothetical protein